MFWRKKANVARPQIIIEVGSDDQAHIRCDWPDGLSTEKQVHMANMLAAAVNCVESGKFRPLILQAIVLAGKIKNQDQLAAFILQAILHGLAKQGLASTTGYTDDLGGGGDDDDNDDDQGGGDGPREDPPIVSPDRVFNVESNQ